MFIVKDLQKLLRPRREKLFGDGRQRRDLNYVDDVQLPDMVYGHMVRSPYAHARLKGVNTAEAMKLPGVRSTKCSKIGITVDFQSLETCERRGSQAGLSGDFNSAPCSAISHRPVIPPNHRSKSSSFLPEVRTTPLRGSTVRLVKRRNTAGGGTACQGCLAKGTSVPS